MLDFRHSANKQYASWKCDFIPGAIWRSHTRYFIESLQTLWDVSYSYVHFRGKETEALTVAAELLGQGCLCTADWLLRALLPFTSVLVVTMEVGCMNGRWKLSLLPPQKPSYFLHHPPCILIGWGYHISHPSHPPLTPQGPSNWKHQKAITNLSLLFPPKQDPAVSRVLERITRARKPQPSPFSL